jgi:hypothetical protein
MAVAFNVAVAADAVGALWAALTSASLSLLKNCRKAASSALAAVAAALGRLLAAELAAARGTAAVIPLVALRCLAAAMTAVAEVEEAMEGWPAQRAETAFSVSVNASVPFILMRIVQQLPAFDFSFALRFALALSAAALRLDGQWGSEEGGDRPSWRPH